MQFVNVNNKLFFCVSGPRSFISRRSLITLIMGMFVGFSMAILFTSSSTKSYWMPYSDPHSNHHDINDNDPHNGNALSFAAGPEFDVG